MEEQDKQEDEEIKIAYEEFLAELQKIKEEQDALIAVYRKKLEERKIGLLKKQFASFQDEV